ncbi:MAG: hypothetical protein AB1489_32195 [Acidobacteriota bacterium]
MSKDVEVNKLDILSLEDLVWIAAKSVGLLNYDFPFQTFFACRHPWQHPDRIKAVGRFGVTIDYQSLYQELMKAGIELISLLQSNY